MYGPVARSRPVLRASGQPGRVHVRCYPDLAACAPQPGQLLVGRLLIVHDNALDIARVVLRDDRCDRLADQLGTAVGGHYDAHQWPAGGVCGHGYLACGGHGSWLGSRAQPPAVTQQQRQADRGEDEPVTPGHAGTPGLVGVQGDRAVTESRGIARKPVAWAEHDTGAADVGQLRRVGRQAQAAQRRHYRLPRLAREILVAHPGDRQAAPAQQLRLALNGQPAACRFGGQVTRHVLGAPDRMRSGDLLAQRVSDPPQVPDQVDDPYVDSGAGQRQRLDRPLARIHHIAGAGLGGDGTVEGAVARAVAGQVGPESPVGQPRRDQPGQVALPGHAALQPVHGSQLIAIPSGEGVLADPLPEGAVSEGQPAAAALAARRGPAEQVDQLADVDEARYLAQDPFQQRAAGTAGSRDVDDNGQAATGRAGGRLAPAAHLSSSWFGDLRKGMGRGSPGCRR